MDPTSVELVAQHAAGNPAAAREIYHRYAARLLGLARRMLSDKLSARVDPEDIVQSAYRSFFTKTQTGQLTIRESGELWRLLITITRHKLLHQVEKQTAEKRSPAREQFASDLATADPSPEDVAALAEELCQLMHTLSHDQRLFLEMRLRDEPLEAIAAALDKSPRTVRRMQLELRRLCERRLQADVDTTVTGSCPSAQPAGTATLDYRDFVLEQLVGSGGFGKVYRAYWRSREQTVAVKMLRKNFLIDLRVVRRFLHEAQIIAGLSHPGIIHVHGLGRTPAAGYFLVLDWHSRGDISMLNDLSVGQLANYLAEISASIAHVHANGVVHCDLKPSNLLLADDGHVIVTDFGFATGFRQFETPIPTSNGGTLGFSAPELLAGENPTPACDMFSLGRVLEVLLDKTNLVLSSEGAVHGELRQIARQCQSLIPDDRVWNSAALAVKLRNLGEMQLKDGSPAF